MTGRFKCKDKRLCWIPRRLRPALCWMLLQTLLLLLLIDDRLPSVPDRMIIRLQQGVSDLSELTSSACSLTDARIEANLSASSYANWFRCISQIFTLVIMRTSKCFCMCEFVHCALRLSDDKSAKT